MPLETPPASALAFAFRRRRLLVHHHDRGTSVPTLGDLAASSGDLVAPSAVPDLVPVRQQYLGTLDGRPVVSAELVEEIEAPDGMAFLGLRSLFGRLSEDLFWIAARAEIVAWDRDHQFCGRCGNDTEDQEEERSKKCPRCGLVAYPRLSPAVIVLVERGDEVLLARSPHFVPGMYSTLAGFVEPGEDLEHTMVREIEEEVGVAVANVRYFGSQPWPFPNSLMIGFRADYAGGEIVLEDDEIEDAAWFRADELPCIPPRLSIARALIDAFLAEHG